MGGNEHMRTLAMLIHESSDQSRQKELQDYGPWYVTKIKPGK